MLKRLALHNFKNFRRTSLDLACLTTIIGTNASGKSNLGDALRFLNGIGLEYPVADIFGGTQKGESGWAGLRGGTTGAAYYDKREFQLTAEFELDAVDSYLVRYSVGVDTGGEHDLEGSFEIDPPRIVHEGLYFDGHQVFSTRTSEPSKHPPTELAVDFRVNGQVQTYSFSADRPVLQQLVYRRDLAPDVWDKGRGILDYLASMRFLNFDPVSMRRPSVPGQKRLRDDGGNLSGVLYDLLRPSDTNLDRRSELKDTLLSWLAELTPMDARDIRFRRTDEGKVSTILVERSGQETPASSASDGTLRFLGFLAALFGRERPELIFVEEPETGLHPARLHLLVNLIEQRTRQGGPQIVASSHSPQFLRMLSESSLSAVQLAYRPISYRATGARFIRLFDIADAKRIVSQQDVAELFEAGWFEDMAGFRDGDENQAQIPQHERE